MAALTSSSRSRIGRCCGQCASHRPHLIQSPGAPWIWIGQRYEILHGGDVVHHLFLSAHAGKDRKDVIVPARKIKDIGNDVEE